MKQITFAEYDSELFRLFGLIDGSSVALTLRGGLQGSGNNDIEGVIINLRGISKNLILVVGNLLKKPLSNAL